MTASQLLSECAARGIRLALAGSGRLSIDAPRDALTPELLEELRDAKPELLQILQAPRRCSSHIDHRHWLDTPATGRPGWIRTTCRLCGAFIGYRPSEN